MGKKKKKGKGGGAIKMKSPPEPKPIFTFGKCFMENMQKKIVKSMLM